MIYVSSKNFFFLTLKNTIIVEDKRTTDIKNRKGIDVLKKLKFYYK